MHDSLSADVTGTILCTCTPWEWFRQGRAWVANMSSISSHPYFWATLHILPSTDTSVCCLQLYLLGARAVQPRLLEECSLSYPVLWRLFTNERPIKSGLGMWKNKSPHLGDAQKVLRKDRTLCKVTKDSNCASVFETLLFSSSTYVMKEKQTYIQCSRISKGLDALRSRLFSWFGH